MPSMMRGWKRWSIMRPSPEKYGAQQSVELRAIGVAHDRVNPDQHAVELQQLLPSVVDRVVAEDDGLGRDAARRQGLEDWLQPALLRRRDALGAAITAPEDAYAA